MDQAERERQHQANLERINGVQRVVGRGDRLRIDHEGTLLERARLLAEEIAAHAATERGLESLDRLLRVAEENPNLRRTRDIVDFVEAVWNNKPLALRSLRGADLAVGDDMVAVLDAFRYARLNLVENVAGGPKRVARLVRRG
jgi:hypothetical protein